jgi:acyl-coenzyme A synthetase/AMP-(fatty) acid ligase
MFGRWFKAFEIIHVIYLWYNEASSDEEITYDEALDLLSRIGKVLRLAHLIDLTPTRIER